MNFFISSPPGPSVSRLSRTTAVSSLPFPLKNPFIHLSFCVFSFAVPSISSMLSPQKPQPPSFAHPGPSPSPQPGLSQVQVPAPIPIPVSVPSPVSIPPYQSNPPSLGAASLPSTLPPFPNPAHHPVGSHQVETRFTPHVAPQESRPKSRPLVKKKPEGR